MTSLLLLLAQLGCALPDDGKPAAEDSGDADSGAPCDVGAWLPDADGDGFGAENAVDEAVYACEQPDGYALDGGDCDDADAAVNPGAAERCDTEADDDCDGSYGEDGAEDCTDRWLDEDADGYGVDGRCMCPTPEDTGGGDGFGAYTATEGGDCDDTDPLRTLDCTAPAFEDPAAAPARLVCDRDDECGSIDAVGDFDGDGAPDVAWYAPDGAVVAVTPVPLAGDAGMLATALGTTEPHSLVGGLADIDGTLGDELVTALADCETGDGGSTATCQLTVRAWRAPDLTTPAAGFVGPSFGGYGVSYGAVVVGDIDADGRDDVLAWHAQNWSSGQVWWPPLGDGGDTVSDDLTPLIADTWLGVHGPGDLDGDGVDDLVVMTLDGRAVVFDGPVPPNITAADGRVALTGDFESRYESWVPAGDLDGDGRAELVVHGLTDLYVLAGPLTDGAVTDLAVAWLGSTGSSNQIGDADASGDADGDGRADLLFGARNSDAAVAEGGLVGLLHGPVAGTYGHLDADVLWAGAGNEHLGATVDFAGDLDGDGASELLMSGLWDTGAGSVGVAHVIGGR